MKLLLLGGTADARRLAKGLQRDDIEVIYSVAGLVRLPDVDCQVISGGFTQYGGLRTYIEQQSIDAVLDATHPYAQNMTEMAWAITREMNLPYWRFHRAPWQAQTGDDWQQFERWDALLAELAGYQSVFLTAGQIDEAAVEVFGKYGERGQRQLLRTAVEPSHNLPASMCWVKAIGPFDLENEQALMQEHQVDVLVSKNSGGKATEAKLTVARELGIPVLMLKRPELPDGITIFDNLDESVEAVFRACRDY